MWRPEGEVKGQRSAALCKEMNRVRCVIITVCV